MVCKIKPCVVKYNISFSDSSGKFIHSGYKKENRVLHSTQ